MRSIRAGPIIVFALVLAFSSVSKLFAQGYSRFDSLIVAANNAPYIMRVFTISSDSLGTNAFSGTGFCFTWKNSQLIGTAAHIVDGIDTVVFHSMTDWTSRIAVVKKKSPHFDFVLLKIVGPALDSLSCSGKFGNSDLLRGGEPIAFVSASEGQVDYEPEIGIGFVSKRQEKRPNQKEPRLIKFNASAHLGVSGAPIINFKGEIVGMVNQMSPDAAFSYAVPSNDLVRFISSDKNTVEFVDSISLTYCTYLFIYASGGPCKAGSVIIASIGSKSTAYATGLRVGDALVSIENPRGRKVEIKQIPDLLLAMIFDFAPGDSLILSMVRVNNSGKEISFKTKMPLQSAIIPQ